MAKEAESSISVWCRRLNSQYLPGRSVCVFSVHCRKYTPQCLFVFTRLCVLFVFCFTICVLHIGYSHRACATPDGHPSYGPLSQGISECLAPTIISSHIVPWSTSHQSLMPAVAMWPYLSLWSCPRCLPVPLSVSKRLLGTNPSCHSRQWIIAPNLSAFMTRAHIDYQLHPQQISLCTRRVPAAQ